MFSDLALKQYYKAITFCSSSVTPEQCNTGCWSPQTLQRHSSSQLHLHRALASTTLLLILLSLPPRKAFELSSEIINWDSHLWSGSIGHKGTELRYTMRWESYKQIWTPGFEGEKGYELKTAGGRRQKLSTGGRVEKLHFNRFRVQIIWKCMGAAERR